MNGIGRLALRRRYTSVVLAMLIALFGAIAAADRYLPHYRRVQHL
jgi:hypothetical protein